MMKSNNYRLRHNVKKSIIKTKSIIRLSHGVEPNWNLAYFPKFQKATRYTWKYLAAHGLRTTGLSYSLPQYKNRPKTINRNTTR